MYAMQDMYPETNGEFMTDEEFDKSIEQVAWETFKAGGRETAIRRLVDNRWVFDYQEAANIVDELIDNAYSLAYGDW